MGRVQDMGKLLSAGMRVSGGHTGVLQVKWCFHVCSCRPHLLPILATASKVQEDEWRVHRQSKAVALVEFGKKLTSGILTTFLTAKPESMEAEEAILSDKV